MTIPNAPDPTAVVSSPTQAHQAQLALFHGVLVEVARRRKDDLPGLQETLEEDVVVTLGGTTRAVHGWFAADIWRYRNGGSCTND